MSQAYNPQASPSPARPAGPRGWLVALLSLIALVAVSLGGFWLWNVATRPGTVTPTAAETCSGGELVDGVYFAATVPVGWCRDKGVFNLRNPKGSVMVLGEEHNPFDATRLCDDAAHAKNPYKVQPLPNGTWGGQPTVRYEIMLTATDVTSYFTCASVKGSVYILLGSVGEKNEALNQGDTKANYDAAEQSVLSTWVWK